MDLTTQFDVFATWVRARFANSERGASLVEYALLVALIAVLCIGALKFLSGKTQTSFSNVGSSIN
jgi:pilus assembly protein Flp/PilA